MENNVNIMKAETAYVVSQLLRATATYNLSCSLKYTITLYAIENTIVEHAVHDERTWGHLVQVLEIIS